MDDHDRPQLKIAAAALDPLGMPLPTAVVPGNSADGTLCPGIRAVQQPLGAAGRAYEGDRKIAALAIRAFVAAGGGFHLCPQVEDDWTRLKARSPVFLLDEGDSLRKPSVRMVVASTHTLVSCAMWRRSNDRQAGRSVQGDLGPHAALTLCQRTSTK
jgi:hypothetical protein